MALQAKMTHLPPGEQANRCDAFDGQERAHCKYQAMEGTTRCEMHGGNFTYEIQAKKNQRTYLLGKWEARHSEFHDADTIKSLREEVAIARMTMEAILIKCETNYDLMIHSSKIALMLDKINTLVVSCNKLEDRLGLVLDKSAIINLAENIIQIVGVHVPEDKLALIADEIAEAVTASGKIPIK